MSKLRIAIIGAGPCGLGQLLAFKQAEQEQQVELVCFERQSECGGLWIYTSHIGIDNHGEAIHSSMYRHLWSNVPKEIIEYPNYTFAEHFGCDLPSYVPRSVIHDYIIGRTKAGDIKQFIRFNTAVRHVDFDDDKKQFNIEIEDFNTHSMQTLHFDHVIVATGHYHVPNMIHVDGVDQFPGRVLHSHDFRGADEFTGLNVLVIGGSMSADDIALQCYKFGARSVTISSRRGPLGAERSDKAKEVLMLDRMEGRKAFFKDHTTIENVDAIIFCTGYQHSYPFMAKRFRLHCGITDMVPSNLYKSIFWIDQPSLAYLGAPRHIYTGATFELQAALVRDVFLGHIKLPEKDQQQVDVNHWQDREKEIAPTDFPALLDFVVEYLNDLLTLLTTYKSNQSYSKSDLIKINDIGKKFLETRCEDIVNYRNMSYESVVDRKKKKAIQLCQPWLKNMDDSLESFIKNYK